MVLVFQKAFVFIKSHIAWAIGYIVVYILQTTHGLLTNEMSGGLARTRWANPSVKVGFAPPAREYTRGLAQARFTIFDFWKRCLSGKPLF